MSTQLSVSSAINSVIPPWLTKVGIYTTVLQPARIRSSIDFLEICLSQLMWAFYLEIIEYLHKAIFDA